MPTAIAADGTELYWEQTGSGPSVVLVPYWSYHPSVFAPLKAELAGDHRVIRYDDRGTGRSERVGPYDIETSAADLRSVIEAAGGPVIAAGLADAAGRAVRVAAERPDLISHVLCLGGAPLPRSVLGAGESMLSSDAVVSAFMQQMRSDYRSAIRGLMASANPQMTPDELRERVAAQVEHVPVEAADARVRAWTTDDAAEAPGRALGERLTVALPPTAAGGWLPPAETMAEVLTRHFPGVRLIRLTDGILSRPDETAAVIRLLSTPEVAPDVGSAA